MMAIPQLVSKVFGTRFARELRRLRPIVDAIHRHEATLGAWPDAEIQRQTERFRARLGERVGFKLVEIIPCRRIQCHMLRSIKTGTVNESLVVFEK